MSVKKIRIINCIISILILLASLIITVIDYAVPSVNILIHPVLTFILCMCVGFGFFQVCLGLIKKSIYYIFWGSILLGLALIYVVSCLLVWWIGLISVIVFWLIMLCLSMILNVKEGTESTTSQKEESSDSKEDN